MRSPYQIQVAKPVQNPLSMMSKRSNSLSLMRMMIQTILMVMENFGMDGRRFGTAVMGAPFDDLQPHLHVDISNA